MQGVVHVDLKGAVLGALQKGAHPALALQERAQVLLEHQQVGGPLDAEGVGHGDGRLHRGHDATFWGGRVQSLTQDYGRFF